MRNSFYDYSKVVYVDMVTPIIIGCPIHGDFMQTPDHHKLGNGCPCCSGHKRLNQKTKEEHKEYWIKNKITSSTQWIKHWKESNLQEQGYSCKPWRTFYITTAEWVEYVCGKKKVKTKEEVKEYWIKNKITNSKKWIKHWQESNLQEQGYHCCPRQSFGIKAAEWTEYVCGKKKVKKKEETKKYCVKNGITNNSQWHKHYKENNLQEQGYPSNCASKYKMSDAEWTEYVCGKKKVLTSKKRK